VGFIDLPLTGGGGGGGSPSGPAGGDLSGTYPNPALVATGVSAGTYGSTSQIPIITVDLKGRLTAVSLVTATATAAGPAGGDLSGTYPNPSVATVGTSSAANIHAAELLTNAATNLNTASAIVKRDSSGNFSAGTVTGSFSGPLTGNVTGNVSGTAANVTGIVAIANGGTNASTAPAARVNLNIDQRTSVNNTNYTVLSTDRYVAQVGTMSAPRTFTLPAASSVNAGQLLVIGDESGTVSFTNNLTVTASGGDLINGAASKVISTPFAEIRLMSDGASKWTLNIQGVARGGTGLTAFPTNGQLLIGTGSGYALANLTAGDGMAITNASGSITLASNAFSNIDGGRPDTIYGGILTTVDGGVP
jgi:hypothetical protein